MTVADYCVAYEREEITINKIYQRNDRVWPSQARSFLIETMCLGYPVPKFILNQIFATGSKKPTKEIVDGQQRSKVITDFYNNRLRLSKNLALRDIAGKIFDELPDLYQDKFLNCSLDIDLFVGADFADVVEAFRRLNSYTFPLNAPEKRHANYQRGLKWIIFYFCRKYELFIRAAGLFSDKSLVRMNDTTLIAEIWHALQNGITTTKPSDLDKLYKLHDVEPFDPEPYQGFLGEAFDMLQDWKELHNSPLFRQHIVYALVLAIIHVRHRIEHFESIFASPGLGAIDKKRSLRNLTTLATAFEAKDTSGPFAGFVEASTDKTNVQSQREERFRIFCEALTKEL